MQVRVLEQLCEPLDAEVAPRPLGVLALGVLLQVSPVDRQLLLVCTMVSQEMMETLEELLLCALARKHGVFVRHWQTDAFKGSRGVFTNLFLGVTIGDFSGALENWAMFDGKFEIYVEFGGGIVCWGMIKVEF